MAATHQRLAASAAADLAEARERTLALVAPLSDADVADVLVNQFESGGLALDPSGIYLVMASPEIAESSGFGTSYCGWHGRTEWRTADVRFAFIGWPARAPNRRFARCSRTCWRAREGARGGL